MIGYLLTQESLKPLYQIKRKIIKIDNKVIKVKSSVKRLSVQTDAELNFDLHIANICRSAAN